MQRQPPKGSRAVIIGNGPSVDVMPSGFWAGAQDDTDCMLIGTNRALCITALQGVRFDAVVIRDSHFQLWMDSKLGVRYHQELWLPATCWRVGSATRRSSRCEEFLRPLPGWQYERVGDDSGESAIMDNHTVVVMAANWAWLQGARDIALTGVDYGPGPDGRLHATMIAPWGASPRRGQEVYRKQIPCCTVLEYRDSAAAVAAAGGRMVNVTPGTRLRAVPRCDAMEWLGKGWLASQSN